MRLSSQSRICSKSIFDFIPIKPFKCALTSREAFSIKEIAFQSGFTSESNFCYTFRKQEGMTPGTYRDKMKGSEMGSGPSNKV